MTAPVLPAPTYTVVTTDAELAVACARWQLSEALGLDTEFMRVSTFYPELGLLQVADGEQVTLIDPLGIKDWQPFKALMLNPAIVKVVHSCSEDLLVFITFLQSVPMPIFDTQIAAALLGEGSSLSYQNLVKQRFGVEVPKTETRSDWLQRPLTREQLDYAALDVAYLVQCWRAQRDALQQQGRETWQQEECLRLADIYRSEFSGDFSDYYLNFKSGWQLRPRSLLALQKLANWREQRARKRNRPRNWILKDAALFTIANSLLVSKAQLAAVEEVSENFVRYEGDEVLALVQQASSASEAECPPKQPPPLTNAQKQQLRRMQELVEARANELNLPPELLGRKRALMPLLYAVLRLQPGETVRDADIPLELLGWRRQLILEPLLKLLQS
ncbi:MAG TPA: ribonuclease D [Candidatus Acidoferrum sp.]|nr:ribonuclease D [Candidatus Acidoferrum sp.]